MKSRKLGLYLRQLRKNKNMTMPTLAEMLQPVCKNMSKNRLNNTESSGIVPHMDVLKKMAEIFEVDINTFLYIIRQDNPEKTESRILKTSMQYNTELDRQLNLDDFNKKELWGLYDKAAIENYTKNKDVYDDICESDALSNFGWG